MGVVQQQIHPRSFVVETPAGEFRRNRTQFNKLSTTDAPNEPPANDMPNEQCHTDDFKEAPPIIPGHPTTPLRRSARITRTPEKLKDFVGYK